MKLRFDQQSMRMRVRKSDLEKLRQEGFIEETVHFPSGMLSYRITSGGHSQEVFFRDGRINVQVPADILFQWINSEEVGIYTEFGTEKPGESLKIILEKDFPCQHGSVAENADTFGELASKHKR